jgi:hypothetical protein
MAVDEHGRIVPEPIDLDAEHTGYAPGHWNYPRRCADVTLALASARERVEEWDPADGHGWWHERPHWIALHNEVVRLRQQLAVLDRIHVVPHPAGSPRVVVTHQDDGTYAFKEIAFAEGKTPTLAEIIAEFEQSNHLPRNAARRGRSARAGS